ncbi:MAG: ABC transporter ATP-binding protein [Lachnospiraceae bacterium]|nr:ABC transporter ATP-binding protein [Lachnospiraceae bacterium]
MSYIEIKSLYKIYSQGTEKIYALNDLSLCIEKGEFIAILGPSGSGKSTLLNILGGLDSPTDGKIYVDGEDISCYSDTKLAEYRRKTVGFVFQSYNLLPALNVRENIEMPLLIDGQKFDNEYIKDIEDSLEILELTGRLPSQLSGGQQQRVAIARALANKPSIILADEPTGNLDSKISKKVLELLLSTCRKYGQTLVMITHNDEIATKADRIIKIWDGKICDE